MTTHYTNSKGKPVAIADMFYPHLANAHAKLLREEPHRTDEIAAMGAELARRDAEQAEQQESA
jgi:hypothetical protein